MSPSETTSAEGERPRGEGLPLASDPAPAAEVERPAPPEQSPGAAQAAEKPAHQKKQRAPKTVARSDQAQAGAADARVVDVTMIVPVQTGDGRVRDIVEACGAELERLGRSYECILVFDGVRGPAWDDAQKLALERPGRVLPIAFLQPVGESTCLTAAFERARGAIIVTSPQYVQVDPYELTRMLAAIDAGADFVAPWRHPRIDPYLNRVQSALFNWVMRKIIHTQFHDLNCYFRVFKRQVLEEVAIYGDQYRFLPATAARQGFKVVEVKVRHVKEWGGTGFFGVGVYARRLLDIVGVVFLSKFTLKPLRFFGTLGGVFALVGATLCVALFVAHQVVERPGALLGPIFMLGVLLFVLGVQVIGFGLVGEIIIYTQARNLREYRIERIWESGPKTHDDVASRDAAGREAASRDADLRTPSSGPGNGGEGGRSQL